MSEDEAHNGLKKATRALIKDGIVKNYRAKTGLFTLEQKPNGDCIYLNSERRCSIYDKRPTVCRRFPEIGPKPGHCPAQKIAKNLKR